MLAPVVHGSRASLLVGLTTAFVAAVIGSVVGATAGYFGRRVDDVLMRITELFQVVPRFFLAILVAALFGANLRTIILLLGLTFWPGPARLLRSQVLALRERDFVLAARPVVEYLPHRRPIRDGERQVEVRPAVARVLGE